MTNIVKVIIVGTVGVAAIIGARIAWMMQEDSSQVVDVEQVEQRQYIRESTYRIIE